MIIVQENCNGAIILTPKPGVDSSTAKELEDVLSAAITTNAGGSVVLDLIELDYISSAGLRSILIGAKAAKGNGGNLVLCAMKPHIRRIFDTSGFTKLVAIVADRDNALAPA